MQRQSRQGEKRKRLNVQQKLEICLYKEKNPGVSLDQLRCHFNQKWGTNLGRSTLHDILKTKDKRKKVGVSDNAEKQKTVRTAQNPELEQAVYEWFVYQRHNQNCITDEILRQKSQELGNMMGIEGFRYSDGWLSKFKKRYQISLGYDCGEPGNISDETLQREREKLKSILRNYPASDIFNCDETGLFFKLRPKRSLVMCGEDARGVKREKERLTVLLTCNADGSQKQKPLVIYKQKNPRIFKKNKFEPNAYVEWCTQKSNWMDTFIFKQFLHGFNQHMAARNRFVCLLLDNAPPHKVGMTYSHVRVEFLCPNSSALLQPLDAGIIRSFKCQYRKFLLQGWVQDIDKQDRTKRVNLMNAVKWISQAWNNVTELTIRNCWRHVDILNENQIFGIEGRDAHEDISELNEEISRLELDEEEQVDVEDYVEIYGENVVFGEKNDQEIIQDVLYLGNISEENQIDNSNNNIDDDDDDDDDVDLFIPSSKEVGELIDPVLNFVGQEDFRELVSEESMSTIIKGLHEMQIGVKKFQKSQLHQTSIDRFMKN